MPRLPRYRGRVLAALALGAFAASSARDAGAVATTARYAHVAALMVDGRTFVAGGLDATNTPLNTVEIIDTLHGAVFVTPSQNSFAASMAFARSSATITVLPNSNILVAGGYDGGAGPRSDVEVYNPNLNSWTTVAGMQDGRMDHTATLLNNGTVLICGGQNALGLSVSSTCDIFTPTNGTTCLAAGGCITPGPNLLLGRARHTSTLLRDGTVWLAGGWNPAQPSGGWVVTTERYYPSQGLVQQAQPLNEARGYHTATLDGDNKVIVVGGFNGVNRKDQVLNQPTGFGFLTSRGIIQSTEIFDPTGGSIVPGPPMQVRVHKHATALQSDGEVVIYGGLGNIATTKLAASLTAPTFGVGSYVSASVSTGVQNGYTNIPSTAGAGSIYLSFFLDTPVTGQIIDGEVDFTSAIVTLNGAYADFVTGDENLPAVGLRASLQGATVDCDPATKQCGRVQTTVNLLNMAQGGYHIAAPKDQTQLLIASTVNGTLNFTPATINAASSVGTITGGSFNLPLELNVSPLTVGWLIKNVNCSLSLSDVATWSELSTYTVTLNGGSFSLPGPFTVTKSGQQAYIDIPSATFTGLAGTISYTGVTGNAPVTSPFAFPSAALSLLSCSMDYTSTGINLDNGVLNFANYYALIRDMVFGDYEFYAPSKNAWTFNPVNGTITRPSDATEGAAMIHMPWDDFFTLGGRYCGGVPLCTSLVAAKNGGGGRQDYGLLQTYTNFSVGSVADNPHAYHTASLLSNGTILLAGGTDGAYVLPYGEIFDPVQGVFTSTGILMNSARQQHSANLLPNGRVLIAGGFATTAASTGPTNTAELYYPDTQVFINTPVMISSHSQHAAVGLPNGNVFIAGGYNNLTTVTNVAEVYYATSGAWGQLANMPAGRAIAPAVQLQDGRILICGGTNQNGNQSSCAAYNPATNLWNNPTTPASMPTALQGHTMTVMADGRVLVAGGDDGFGETTSSYLYDPVGNTWLTTNPLISARFGHDATLLPNGEVMISGGVQQVALGQSSTANALRTIEYYHPLSAQWDDGGGASKFNAGPRSFHTTTLATNGNVYYFGGANGSIGAAQSTAFYTKYETNYFTGIPDGNSRITPSLRQSSITFVTPSPFLPGASFTASGLRFRGATEGSGGATATGNPSFNYPRLILQKIDGSGGSASGSSPGFVADLTTLIPANAANLSTLDTSLQVTLPASSNKLPYGWYMTWVGNNDVHSLAAPLVQVGPAKPTAVIPPVSVFTQGTSSINYTWSAVAGPLDGYEVYSATSGLFLTTIAVSGSPSYMQTNLLPNTTAGILVAAYTLTGDGPLTASPTSYTLPNPPSGLYITSVTFNTLGLVWSPNQNLAGTIYEVGESSDNFVTSFSTPVPEIVGLTNTFVTIQNLQPSTTYYFRVRSYNSAGLPSSWTASVSTLTRTSVSGVTGVAVSPTSIQWNWAPAGAVLNYKVYDSTSGLVLASPVSNSFLDTGLGIDTARSIQVSAVTPAGEGPLSSPTTVYTQAAMPAPVVPVLLGLTTGSFTLQWAPNGNPNGIPYSIALIDYSVPSVGVVQYTTITAFTAGFGNLNPAVLYYTQIAAVNGDGYASAPLIVGSTYTLAAPAANLKVVNTTPVSVSAAWSPGSAFVSTNTFYQVTYSTDNFVNSVSTAIPFASLYNGTTVTITGLLTSTTYWLRVAAENPFGQVSAFSNVVATITYNGGAPLGSVAGVLTALGSSEFFGNLGNGRSIDIRSPGGSFPVDTKITISSQDATVPLCPGGLNVAVSITAAPALQPTTPIYFKASYVPAELGAGPIAQIRLERIEPVTGTCVPLQTTFDTVHQTFTAQLNHFSFYELVAVPLATDTNSLRVFPNPFRSATDSFITFDQIPPASRVRVMTLRGETVMDAAADGSGLLTWNATNGSGRSVASGLYIVVVESGGSKKITKLAVVR